MNDNSTFKRSLRRLVALTLAVGLCSSMTWAQTRTVTGKITSKEDGAAMPGVNIVLKGTQKGTSTNALGAYVIEVTGANPTLVFSFVGYDATEIAVGNRSVVDVVMNPGAENLKEVVVTALDRKSVV